MGETIQLRNPDPLHGGKVDLLVAWDGNDLADCPAVIRRGAATNPFLGPSGWQATEHRFHPRQILREDGRLVLRFGSELVDNTLHDDDIVQISLPDPGLSDVVTWTGITRSVTVTTAPPTDEPARRDEPAEPTASIILSAAPQPGFVQVTLQSSEPVPEGLSLMVRRDDAANHYLGRDGWQPGEHRLIPASQQTSPDGTVLIVSVPDLPAGQKVRLFIPEARLSDAAVWPEITSATIVNGNGSGTASGQRWLLPVLALLLLAMVGGGFWWWQTRVMEPDELTFTDQAGPTEPPEGAEGDAATQSGTETTAEVIPPAPVVDVDPAQAAYERAVAAISADQCDTARREMLTSISHEYGPALLAWGQAQGSVGFEGCLTETSNDVSALDHIRRACAVGTEGAAEGLQQLIAALERNAELGEGAAADVLRLAVPSARDACGI